MPYIQVFVEHEERECPMCGKRFIPKHGKRRFCQPKCQNRYGVRQYRERKREERMMQGVNIDTNWANDVTWEEMVGNRKIISRIRFRQK